MNDFAHSDYLELCGLVLVGCSFLVGRPSNQ